MPATNEWVTYYNGEIVPEREVWIPFRDRGFKLGDAVFDTTRTFDHRIFKLEQHVDRLFRSLAYLQIDPGLSPRDFMDISEKVAERNLALVPKDEDIWISQQVSRGLDVGDRGEWPDYAERTVIVDCQRLPHRERGEIYRDGFEVLVPSVRRPATDVQSSRAKMRNYLNFVLAELEVKAGGPKALAVLLDTHGNLAEGHGANVFLVKDGTLFTPRRQGVLGGISRETVIELASEKDVAVIETDLDLYDARNADEAFMTATSWCVCPISRFNGAPVGTGPYPGPVTRAIMDAYIALVGCDWEAQCRRYLNEG